MKKGFIGLMVQVSIVCSGLTLVQGGQPSQGEPQGPPVPTVGTASPMDRDLNGLMEEWAHIKYEVPDKNEQEQQMGALMSKASTVTKIYHERAEPYIWEAIITSTQAGIVGGLGALGYAKDAKKILEQAEAINPRALDGAIYTSLGALYYQVPGWPIGFGDDEKARAYLERARTMSPDDIDSNYFYGEFLIDQGEYAKAIAVLEHALAAPDRPNRPIADAGRRAEIRQSIAMAKKKL